MFSLPVYPGGDGRRTEPGEKRRGDRWDRPVTSNGDKGWIRKSMGMRKEG
jgi:hypothetical protein